MHEDVTSRKSEAERTGRGKTQTPLEMPGKIKDECAENLFLFKAQKDFNMLLFLTLCFFFAVT